MERRPFFAVLQDMVGRLDVPSSPVPEPEIYMATRAVALTLSQTCFVFEAELSEPDQEKMTGKFRVRGGCHPSMCIEDYTERIVKYMAPNPDEMIAALVLADRLVLASAIAVTWRTVHRIYSTALALTLKFTKDDPYMNSYYARVAGLHTDDFNELELELLRLVDFHIWIDPKDIKEYRAYIAELAFAIECNDHDIPLLDQ